jgi:hypothetical protein
MTVEEPLALARGNPSHGHDGPGCHILRDLGPLFGRRIGSISFSVTGTVYPEIRSMKVHGMWEATRVDPTPAHLLSHAILKPFVPRPGLSIDAQNLLGSLKDLSPGYKILPPVSDKKNAVSDLGSRWIDDEGTG